MADGPSDALLLETFGSRLLAYLCNVGVAEVDDRFRDGTPLPHASELALGALIPLANMVAKERLDWPGLSVSSSLRALGTVQDGWDMSWGNAVRSAAGGEIESPRAGIAAEADELKVLLLRLGSDAYPHLLAPAEEPWYHAGLAFHQHPLRPELQRALEGDEQLSRMYPNEDGSLGRRGEIMNSLGRGGTIQSVAFGETLIHAAWDLALMSVPDPSVAEVYEAISASLDLLRVAVAGGDAETRALLAFTGVTTGGRTIQTPWGSLRPITFFERASAPSALNGAVSGTDANGRSLTVSYAGEVVLDTKLPFAVAVTVHERNPGDEFPVWPKFDKLAGLNALRRRTEGLQLGVLLATDRPSGQWATARFSWHWIADPTSQGRATSWRDPRSSAGFMPTELSDDECGALQQWCALIEEHWSPSIDIAVRRVLLAAQVRDDPADRLVDSVIAWENLFGTREGEPTLRISSAMAWLIADTACARTDLQKEIKQLYNYRSKIIHGARFDEIAIVEKANRALDLALASFRALLSDRPDLLRLPDGSARSLHLMMNR